MLQGQFTVALWVSNVGPKTEPGGTPHLTFVRGGGTFATF
jgi:hypothetical protein